MKDVPGFELNGCSGDIKSAGGYVMAAGSVHPDSKERYEVICDDKPAPIPEVILGLRRRETPKDAGAPITENRNTALTSIAGRLRNIPGMSPEALEVALLQVNADRCIPPLDEEEVKRIAKNAASWPEPEAEPVAILGNGSRSDSAGVSPDTYEDEDALEDSPRPRYPDEIWAGTFYGEFADLCTQDNYIPKKFFSESIRTVTGALVGDRLRCPITGVTPRAYTILIAPPGSGKGTSAERVKDFFGAERWDGLARTESPMLWESPQDIAWRTRGIGAQVCSAASAPGLMRAIEERKAKKGETVNPLELWKPMPRIITMAEEIRSLFANFANESTGAGLESVLCELFDRHSFTSTATKDRPPASGRLMYSMLGGITKEGWDSVFSKVESVESGFLSRVNILGTEEERTKSGLRAPDFTALRARMFPFIQHLEAAPRVIDATPAALGYMDHWYSRLMLPEGVSRARLNIQAWRVSLHLAWLKGHASILDEDVDGGIKSAEYLAKMREFYAPPEGETRQARCEASIRKVMRSRRRVGLRDLRRKTNYHRWGLGLWEKALQALVKAGEVRVGESATPQGKGPKTVILLRIKD